ncbi:type III polyketide synthase [Salinibacterium hongtaonis]|uniref:Type III polyketide synthase n=1 Tax=Homoserinimonas hongtaonis TaxID=2079791 RepID=A0A2U1T210_9MICO|nr:3-oxoacyl-[acyl-carrier-protein] synthase III C-terminal domain-containing protein [Salinibacterium hongtaonis]AWB88166.1 type III polyketide synthase [Salinibacterium hongtaonis]PWB97905.1 type III polyketide synthase [Salinibacterium hongtaonis]
MSRIVSVAPVLPENSYSQAHITTELTNLFTAAPQHHAVIHRLHSASGIGTRHTVLPLERYAEIADFGEANSIFIEQGTLLAEKAVLAALDGAGLRAADVDYIFFTSVTGVAAPSIDGILVHRMGFRPDVKRVPSFGLGCVAGASGIARIDDYLAGHPLGVGLLISLELCSLTLQRGDATMANFVATGLFGDGAAAVVMVGEARPEPGITVVDSRSAYYAETHNVIGWNINGGGFEIVLTPGVAEVININFLRDVTGFLAGHSLAVSDIDHWVAHPGGPKILEAFSSALEVPPESFARSWATLERAGNLSSAAVLHVLADVIEGGGEQGESGLLFALGPGVSAEFVLLEWS